MRAIDRRTRHARSFLVAWSRRSRGRSPRRASPDGVEVGRLGFTRRARGPIAILRKKAAVESASLPDDVPTYIASSIRSNVRELEGRADRLAAYASLSKRRIDLELGQEGRTGKGWSVVAGTVERRDAVAGSSGGNVWRPANDCARGCCATTERAQRARGWEAWMRPLRRAARQ